MGMVFCRGCATEIHESARSCPKCGAMQRASANGSASNVVTGILALLLGGIGVHRFYLAAVSDYNRATNILLGLLGFFFSWTFLPMVIGFIEGIVFLVSKDKFDEKYNT